MQSVTCHLLFVKDNSLNDDLKKKQTNDLLEENNTLLSEKIELTNAEKD
ncbi:hypothetical protein P7D59_20835 [Enterococcus avium]|nr:hypothetical protein [Enterococcus avium]MDT2481364.1 hypothetical protein [Enterococcus avium]